MQVSFFRRRLWRTLLTGVLCLSLLFTPVLPYTTAAAENGVSAIFTNPVTLSGGITMSVSGTGDSSYTLSTVQGKPVMTVEKYAYFQISDQALCAAREITVTVTLLDTAETVLFQYCGTDSAYTNLRIDGTATGQFKTVTLALRDAALGNAAQNLRSAFRFLHGTIHSVTVQEGIPRDVSVTFQNPIALSDGISVIPSGKYNGDCVYSLTTVNGKPVAEAEKYIYFCVTNPVLNSTDQLTLSVTYLDKSNSPMLLQYCSTESDYELLHIQRFNTGEFVTAEIPLTNAALGKAGQNYGASFRLYEGVVHSLTISEGYTDPLDQAPPAFAPQTEQNNIIGKGVAGYQVWFRATDKENGNWHHWGQNGKLPTAGNIHTEIYPHTDDYVKNGATLYPSGLGDLGNGNPSVLFNSPDREVIKTHMEWARDYDIDGLAVQRFYSATFPMRSSGKNTLQVIQEEAEATGRLFYVMYDFSYASRNDPAMFIRNVQLDFIYNVEEKGVASSLNYGHADGKPVVCLWGLHGDPASEYFCGTTATTLIDWFHSRGYYVIGGSPDNGYDKATGEYLEPFTKIDMLSLWTPGRYNMDNMETWLKQHVEIDLAFCERYGIDYQPVLYSGFGWTNMGSNGYVNHFPRYAGDFLWKQAYILKRDYHVESLYFAMWDEYDEGTAIMKGASDYFEIPTDQYFLTWAADGWWLSNDYYLRAAGAVVDMIQGKAPLREKIDIPHSEGPVYWRNSFESRETTYTLDDGATKIPAVGQLDVCLNNPAWINKTAFSTGAVAITPSLAKSGGSSFRFKGTASSGVKAIYKIADTRITASAPLELSYSLYAANENGQDVYVDLLFADGTRLSDVNTATVITRGNVGEWVDVTVSVGVSSSKPIVGVAVGYRGNSGPVDAYIDDIVLQHSPRLFGDVDENGIVNSTDARLTLVYAVGKIAPTSIALAAADVDGNGTVNSTDARLILQYAVEKIEKFPLEELI
ncbi:MAG: hypothetical protein E7552_07085 [Ruminococcaceae bacterium]|nr:hypothetical protein [Oscillospiraceae bacterium]